MTDKASIFPGLRLAERTLESGPLGAAVHIRELTRAQWRTATEAARADEEGKILLSPYYQHIFAFGVVDAEGKPIFQPAEVLDFPNRDDVWEEIARIAQAILELSEVGSQALFQDNPAAATG